MGGWSGYCERMVRYLRQSILSGGVRPLDLDYVGANPDTVTAPPTTLGEAVAADLNRRLFLPRSWNMQYNRERTMLESVGTRAGNYRTWWEPYAYVAMVLRELDGNTPLALEYLDAGTRTATNAAPLNCYRLAITTPR